LNLLEKAVNTYLNAVRTLCPNVSHTALNYLKSGLRVVELQPKHFFIHANVIQQEIGFVFQGLIRAFYIDNQGNEITVNFVQENRYATHYTAFITRTPGKYYFQCIEPTILVNLSYDHIQTGYDKFPDIERYGRLTAEEVLKFQQKRIESFLFDTAEQRYLDFIKENPDLFNRVSLSHLSSFLGMERQTLTRIRQKLAKG
jgi:CRP/FNR family transcriptional regulator